MKKGELSFQEIYNQLLSGQKLMLYFPSPQDAETFRVRMHHYKKKQESVLEGLGIKNEDDRTVLSFKYSRDPRTSESPEVIAMAAFSMPSPLRKYPVIILGPDDIVSPTNIPPPDHAEISENLGTA